MWPLPLSPKFFLLSMLRWRAALAAALAVALPPTPPPPTMSDADDDTPNDAGDENGAQGIKRDEEVVEPAPLQLKVGGKAEHPT